MTAKDETKQHVHRGTSAAQPLLVAPAAGHFVDTGKSDSTA